jgi:hypothetical protein
MNQNPNAPSATRCAAAAEAAPADSLKAANSQQGAGASEGTPWSTGWQAESYPMADGWNFRLLV